MPILKLAFDRSARRIDVDGRLHVDSSHISKANVSPYYGQEIPDYETLGLEPTKIYKLFRDPVELERGAHTFERLPILSEHIPVTVDTPKPDLVVGAIGSKVTFNAPYLDADLSFWDAEAIAGIDTDKVRELSCAYRYVADMTPGEYMGQSYDGRMTEIQGNHLALVEVGRAGSDVVVADKNPFYNRNTAMKMSKLSKALFVTLSAISPVLAADSAFPALLGSANRKTLKSTEVKTKILALDEDLDPQQLDDVIDSVLDIDDNPDAAELPGDPEDPAEDESPAEKVRAMLAGKIDDAVIEQICSMFPALAGDEDLDDDDIPAIDENNVSKKDMTAAMDSLRSSLKAAEEARRDVSATVGDTFGMDSASEIYGFALDHLDIDHKDVKGTAALRALYKVATSNKPNNNRSKIAQDAAAVVVQFPQLDRFGRG